MLKRKSTIQKFKLAFLEYPTKLSNPKNKTREAHTTVMKVKRTTMNITKEFSNINIKFIPTEFPKNINEL